jgi:hypothetical protein
VGHEEEEMSGTIQDKADKLAERINSRFRSLIASKVDEFIEREIQSIRLSFIEEAYRITAFQVLTIMNEADQLELKVKYVGLENEIQEESK